MKTFRLYWSSGDTEVVEAVDIGIAIYQKGSPKGNVVYSWQSWLYNFTHHLGMTGGYL